MERETIPIRELAAATGLSSKTLRYWESRGLLPKPFRTHTGYREYPVIAVRRVEFIKRAKTIGLTLSEILKLFMLSKQKGATCQEMDAWVRRKLSALGEQMKTLTRLRKQLEQHQRNWRSRLPCPPLSSDEICCLIEELPVPNSKPERR